jgi:hypothetical protein
MRQCLHLNVHVDRVICALTSAHGLARSKIQIKYLQASQLGNARILQMLIMHKADVHVSVAFGLKLIGVRVAVRCVKCNMSPCRHVSRG